MKASSPFLWFPFWLPFVGQRLLLGLNSKTSSFSRSWSRQASVQLSMIALGGRGTLHLIRSFRESANIQ